LLHAVGRASKN
jgi:leucyl aminopeptidase